MSSLTSGRMQELVKEAAGRFDWVVLDTPPIGVLPDGHLVASMVDGIVFVVAANRTPFASVQKSVAALGPQRVLGIVLNRVEEIHSSGYDYVSHYSHYKTVPPSPSRPAIGKEK